jgi:YVTN family beta-propeller protein
MAWLKNEMLVVANANGDTVSFIDTRARAELYKLSVKPAQGLPFGSMPTALAQSQDGSKLFVANAGNNAIAVIDLVPETPKVIGYLPVAWYPTGISVGADAIYVCNAKGWGSRSEKRPANQGRNSHDHSGTVQRIAITELAKLQVHTKSVLEMAFVPQMLKAMAREEAKSVKAVPLPQNLGEPSVFEHVIYVIKENRTYDQVFGDIKSGNGDPKLCMFGEEITPNHHAIAKEFVLLDNYYCNGVLSADGHSWATEGNVTPYLERAFGGFNRSYTYGDDPITYSSSGFVWDRTLGAGLSFRNYGEFDSATIPGGQRLTDILSARAKGETVPFGHSIGVERVRNYSMVDYPGWNMEIPDQVRMDFFMKEFEEYKKNGRLPNLVIVYLPQNHTGGSVTARAHVADNDYAVGRLVEAVSKSVYWKDTAIFINEDDPQNGFDHVDGHRSVCLVASAYTRNRKTDSTFYNQTSVLRTILHIFGLPPMTQSEAVAPLMYGCFGTRADLKAFKAIVPKIKFDEKYPPKNTLTGPALYWANIRESIPMARTGMKTAEDDDKFNRALWHEMMGYNTPYPVAFAGSHGKGLKKLGLKHSNEDKD